MQDEKSPAEQKKQCQAEQISRLKKEPPPQNLKNTNYQLLSEDFSDFAYFN